MLSLGGGTQSTVLALLADRGELDAPKPDFAVFADTGWEPAAVYENVGWLREVLSFPVVTVTADPDRSLRDATREGVNVRGRPWLSIPAFLAERSGEAAGMNWRQCTSDYKITPIRRWVREQLGVAPRSPVPEGACVEMWLGISVDEVTRMRMSPDRWVVNCYPLVDLGLSRQDCVDWFADEYPGRVLPRSACVGCPYRSPAGWVEMRDTDPVSFRDAVETDRLLRDSGHNATKMFRNRVFLHPARKPLMEAVMSSVATGDGLWEEECAGVCGV